MATSKTANYSDANIATMAEMYTGEDNKAEVSAIAAELGKTIPSVRAKLSSLGLYKTAEKAAATSNRVKKADTVAAIVKAGVKLNEAEADGLEKATASALNKILARLTN